MMVFKGKKNTDESVVPVQGQPTNTQALPKVGELALAVGTYSNRQATALVDDRSKSDNTQISAIDLKPESVKLALGGLWQN